MMVVEATLSVGRVLMLALGSTLVLWTFALAFSGRSDGQAQHFFRMFGGFFILFAVAEMMYL